MPGWARVGIAAGWLAGVAVLATGGGTLAAVAVAAVAFSGCWWAGRAARPRPAAQPASALLAGPDSPDAAGTIYLLEAPARGLWKIGFTARDDVTARLDELRGAAPGERILLRAHGPGSWRQEQALHAQHAAVRRPGVMPAGCGDTEWFALDAARVAAVRAMLSGAAPLPGAA